MSAKLPEFITTEFIQKIFEKNFANKRELKVLKFIGEAVTNPGDNYGSDMTRITVDYDLDGTKLQTNVVFKVMPSNKQQEDVMTKCKVFPREIHTYSKLLTEVDKLLSSIGDTTKFSPECLHTVTQPKMMLVFEDMRDKNYKVRSREYQLNYDEAFALIVKLAKLHAASVILHDRDPSIMEPYMEGSVSKNPERQQFLVHYRNCTRALSAVVENEWGEEWKKIARKLKKLEAFITDKGCELYTTDATTFSVFNHNDLWIKNLFFKNDGDKVEDVLLIDYQLSYFGSIGIDLNALFYGAMSEDVRISSSKELLKIYHQNFKNVLEKLNYRKKIPTLHDIYVEFLKSGFNRVLVTFTVTPILMTSDSSNMNLFLVNSEEGEKFRYSMFNNEKYKKFMQKLLVEFDELGFLE